MAIARLNQALAALPTPAQRVPTATIEPVGARVCKGCKKEHPQTCVASLGELDGYWHLSCLKEARDRATEKPPLAAVPRDPDAIGDPNCQICHGRAKMSECPCVMTPRPPKQPVCSNCNDTHRMWIGGEDDSQEVMCTRCPTPCQKCGGGGPFCRKTPCDCACHKKSGVAPAEDPPHDWGLIGGGSGKEAAIRNGMDWLRQCIEEQRRDSARRAAEVAELRQRLEAVEKGMGR